MCGQTGLCQKKLLQTQENRKSKWYMAMHMDICKGLDPVSVDTAMPNENNNTLTKSK